MLMQAEKEMAGESAFSNNRRLFERSLIVSNKCSDTNLDNVNKPTIKWSYVQATL